MGNDFSWPLDVLQRPHRFVKEDRVYVIIITDIGMEGGHFAQANPDPDKNVTIIETKMNVPGSGAATLLECSNNAGADFASVDVVGDVSSPERVFGLVCPKTDEVKANWFEWYVLAPTPAGPFLWQLIHVIIGTPMRIQFKIRYEPHLVGGPEGKGTIPMVQMYPTNGTNHYQSGWMVLAYRTDKDGTAQMFQSPPEWNTDPISTVFGTYGLQFGKDPPLIAADVPFE